MAPSREFGGTYQEYLDAVRRLIEPQLVALGLGDAQIASQALPELRDSLDRVNEAIAHPEQFGTYGLKLSAELSVVIARSPSEAHVTVGALPILLQRKKAIIDRIRILSPVEQLADLQGVVSEKVTDPEARDQLNTLLEEYAEKQRALAEEAQISGQSALDAALMDVEIRERKWRMRRSLLEREPVATLIGAVVLVSIATALIVAMFTETRPPEILSNAFLVILGYFFGQSGFTDRRKFAGREE